MPVAEDPNRPEFYTYHFVADGVTFYVGHGRAGRAPMRRSHVRGLVRNGKISNSDLSKRVFAALDRAGCDLKLAYVAWDLIKAEAGAREIAEIGRLVALGAVLANVSHNRRAPRSCEAVVEWVLAQRRRRPAIFGPASPRFVDWTS